MGGRAGHEVAAAPRRATAASNDELRVQQEAYAAEVVRYERSRIAADLHDLVGHALSLMVVQAGAGQRTARDREDRARIALEHAGEAAREAQAEVRALAGLLAGEAAADVPGGLGLVAEVVRQARQRPAVPTFADYVPVVSAGVSDCTRKAYGSYWNRLTEQ